MSEQPSALSELRKLGLTSDIDETAAARIWGELLIIAGRVRQGHYQEPGHPWFVQNQENDLDAFHAIAREIIKARTPIEVIEDEIPRVVHSFHSAQQWFPTNISIETMKARELSGPIQEWKGKHFLMSTGIEPRKRQKFPRRAAWLKEQLKERAWNHNDPVRFNGPDRKTMLKILRGEMVREDVLEKLATALNSKGRSKISPTDIPSD